MKTGLVIGAVVIALIVLGRLFDRGARWAARRGWIYYRDPTRPRGVNLGFLDQIYQPSMEHVIEQENTERSIADDAESGSGGPDEPPTEP